MEHNPFISLSDETEITYSDIKFCEKGEYITLYFETPNAKEVSGFNSAQFDYPFGPMTNIVGYTSGEIDELMKHIKKSGQVAYEFAKEDMHCLV